MAGHSKWKNNLHRKGAQDAKRGKIFQKLAKEIYVAAKDGDPNPDTNAKLRAAIEKARQESMPKDNINRAIDRAKGGGSGENYEEIMYEGYGPNGVAVMVYCLTDNRNRTASFVKSTFSKRGGNLGADGSVSYLFNRLGQIVIQKSEIQMDAEEFILEIMEFDIEDAKLDDDVIVITTGTTSYSQVKESIDNLNVVNCYVKSEITMVPTMEVELNDAEAEKVMNLVEILEDNDDVQEVYYNLG